MSTIKNLLNVTLEGQTGTGEFVGSASPSLTTPTLGAATCTSLQIGTAYSLPTSDGTSGQVLSTNGSGMVSFVNAATGTITGGTNLGGGTDTFAGVSGADLEFNTYAAGTNINFDTIGNLTTISASGSGMTFPYEQAFWVAQNNGSDSAAGTSIDTPFSTVQNAINTAGTTPTIIYVVDAFTNIETLATSGAGQTIYIIAPGTTFSGTFATTAGDTVYIQAPAITELTNNQTTYVICNQISNSSNVAGTLSIYAQQAVSISCSGGTTYLDAIYLNGLALATSAICYLTTQNASSITNDGTGVLNGTTNGTTPGATGNFQVETQVIADNIAFSDTTHGIVGTIAADDAASGYVGQFITSVISSPVSTTSTTVKNIGNISLTAGDWDVYGNVAFANTAGALGDMYVWTSLTSASQPAAYLSNYATKATTGFGPYGIPAPYLRVNVNTTTTVYLSAAASYGSGSGSFTGVISARRVR